MKSISLINIAIVTVQYILVSSVHTIGRAVFTVLNNTFTNAHITSIMNTIVVTIQYIS